MHMKERLGEKLCWTQNLEICEVGGVLMSLLGRMRWGYGKILGRVGGKFSSHTKFEVGEFWHDLWCCGNKTLKEAFSDLYGFACTKDAYVAAHLELSSGSNQWTLSFARAVHNC